MTDEFVATCSVCGKNFDETDINMIDYEDDLCQKCEKDHLEKESETKQKAIEKLQAELALNKTDAYIQAIGQFLIKHIEKHPQAAETILATDKTIKKSLEAMKAEAQKKQVNGFAMFTPDEGYALVLKYFEVQIGEVEVPELKTPVNKTSRFDVKLEDLL